MKSIYDFIDPVQFMYSRKKDLALSFSDMANKSGLSSKSFFHKVLHRSKVYSMQRVVPLGIMLNLKGKKQFRYFEIMTFLYRAKAPYYLREEILKKFKPSRY